MAVLSEVHVGLHLPINCREFATVRGNYEFYHYQVDGFDDRGWGCGYRTLQTLCSWTQHALQLKVTPHSPGLTDIQNALVSIQDKATSFVGSQEWIGSFEACLCLEHLYNIQSKIIHISRGSQITEKAQEIFEHFRDLGSPVMIGGDNDSSSKTLLGVCRAAKDDFFFLIADPHYVGAANIQTLQDNGWVQWKHFRDTFIDDSFYNFCLPQLSVQNTQQSNS